MKKTSPTLRYLKELEDDLSHQGAPPGWWNSKDGKRSKRKSAALRLVIKCLETENWN